jgi:hypothetical protein
LNKLKWRIFKNKAFSYLSKPFKSDKQKNIK